MIAPIAAEPAYWMLVGQWGGHWYVEGVATFSGTTAPPADWR
jgi:hypothetical protein